MKVVKNDKTNPNTHSVRSSHVSNYPNMQPSLSGHLSDTGPEPGKHSRMGSPFLGNVQPYVRTHPAQHIAMSRIELHCLLCNYCFFPLFSFVRHRDRRCPCDRLHRGDSFSSAEQPGKQNPLDHSDITHSFSLMLALDFATVFDCSYYNA
jgi:hypothetical protein